MPDAVRPRSCALRFRRFSRNSTARRWVRPDGFADLLSFSSDVMGPHYRISGQRCNLRRSPCACESPMAVSAAFAPLHLGCERSCCRSSVVEHPLGKGEVECSIHSGSTRNCRKIRASYSFGVRTFGKYRQNEPRNPRFNVGKIRGLCSRSVQVNHWRNVDGAKPVEALPSQGRGRRFNPYSAHH